MLDRLRAAKRIGFLFSGGSTRCIFQVGVVETLYGLGIEPAVCLGVSGGAWNAAAVAAGNWRRLRKYWRFFTRMPHIDLRNLVREHSPFNWALLHARAFDRYVREEKIRDGLPLYVALTRLRDDASVIMDLHAATDPFRVLLASNYLRPFYTHPPQIDSERYGDGGWSNNMPYEFLLGLGCDAVVLMTMKGESEGGLYRHRDDWEHVITDDRVIVIRPRYRLPLAFVERRWPKLAPIADLGALRAREVLLGERHSECDLAARGPAPTAYISAIRKMLKASRVPPRA
ncbi:MAG TPA: patatin-like phospholipase family protein [Thermoanaerobaculia bacterium]|jgi:predicted acylesterase/phospholipase RssA|nr:patatin-like phospholipase family protein [Thermoanaerobaculia bacterium]